MRKLILLSILLSTFIIPIASSRIASPMRGLRLAVLGVAAWVAIYVALLSRMHWW
ncbi:MAG: hypothetical protein H7247_15230 [Polaromonas sp.]|nr:hypothetical protein [Gemmatimonadaceae bacterium]